MERKDSISLTVPNEKGALRATSIFFDQLAEAAESFGKVPRKSKSVVEEALAEELEPEALKGPTESVGAALKEAQGKKKECPPPPAATEPAAKEPVALDAAGLPWNKRIHSSNKKPRVKDNLWTPKRGVDVELVKTVEAELRAEYPTDPRTSPAAKLTGATAPAATEPSAANMGGNPYVVFMQEISPGFASKELTLADVWAAIEVAAKLMGVTDIKDIAGLDLHPELVPMVRESIVALWKTRTQN